VSELKQSDIRTKLHRNTIQDIRHGFCTCNETKHILADIINSVESHSFHLRVPNDCTVKPQKPGLGSMQLVLSDRSLIPDKRFVPLTGLQSSGDVINISQVV